MLAAESRYIASSGSSSCARSKQLSATLVSPALLASRPCRLTSRAFCLICTGVKGEGVEPSGLGRGPGPE
eukprot:scaffold68536_cov84-Phaeocystis_antarctica.AAC.2